MMEGYLNVLRIRQMPHGLVVFAIDFQDTPLEYRQKRMSKLRKRYPINEYIWTLDNKPLDD